MHSNRKMRHPRRFRFRSALLCTSRPRLSTIRPPTAPTSLCKIYLACDLVWFDLDWIWSGWSGLP